MPTPEVIYNAGGPLLFSSSEWQQQEALQFLHERTKQNFTHLSDEQLREYSQLQRAAHAALVKVEAENNRIKTHFKEQGLARLVAALKDATGESLNPETLQLNTRYGEIIEPPSFWSVVKQKLGSRRQRRALDESKLKVHVQSMNLWQAACLNFGFGTGTTQKTGASYETASFITGTPAPSLSVKAFIAIARRLNLGQQLKDDIDASLAEGAPLYALIHEASRACIQFELLEALRTAETSRVSPAVYTRFKHLIEQGQAQLILTASDVSSDAYYPLVFIQAPNDTTVLSYFPQRHGGAFVYHPSIEDALQAFKQSLKTGYKNNNLGWFTTQLSAQQLAAFQALRTPSRVVDDDRLRLANALNYSPDRLRFTDESIERFRLVGRPLAQPTFGLAKAVAIRQVARYREGLGLLANSRSEADLDALRERVSQMAGEVLELLTLPLPGGVTGLNKIMLLAMGGSLGYSLISGALSATKGDHETLASGLADSLDLILSIKLSVVAQSAHGKRMKALWAAMGEPKKVTREDGEHELWVPTTDRFQQVDVSLLEGRSVNGQSIYQIGDYSYVKLSAAGKVIAAQVLYDSHRKQFCLVHPDPAAFRPAVVLDTTTQLWRLAIDDTHNLSDIDLLQRMLPANSIPFPDTSLNKMLKSTGIERALLDDVWAGKPAPARLLDAVRRLHADKVIAHLCGPFVQAGELPHAGHHVMLGLLTQLDSWPQDTQLHVFDTAGALIESYSKSNGAGERAKTISIKRLETGRYVDRYDSRVGEVSGDQLFLTIIDQLPETSLLGRETHKERNESDRVAVIRELIANVARWHRPALFEALYDFEGFTKKHAWSSKTEGQQFLPDTWPAQTDTLSQEISTLRWLVAGLSEASAREFLQKAALAPQQLKRLREHLQLPSQLYNQLLAYQKFERVNLAIDAVYYSRPYHPDNDLWARTFAVELLNSKLKRHLVFTDIQAGTTSQPYIRTGPDDTTLELHYLGNGRYRNADSTLASQVPVIENTDSFYLAIAAALTPEERVVLGMGSAVDINGLRTTLGDRIAAQRSPNGELHLDQAKLVAYERDVILSPGLKADHLGIYHLEGKQFLPLNDRVFQIEYDAHKQKFKLALPDDSPVDAPTLEHNEAGAWRLSMEEPLEWSAEKSFRRLGHGMHAWSDQSIKDVLAIAGVSEGGLRQVHRNNLAPPPLLADTCKRFNLLDELNVFVEKMRNYASAEYLDPDLQLFVLLRMPEFVANHRLQLVDEQGALRKEYADPRNPQAPIISMTLQEFRSPELLTLLVERADEAVMGAFLGNDPLSIEQRIVRLAEKMADRAVELIDPLFNSLYSQRDLSTDSRVQVIAQAYPALPKAAIEYMLQQATQVELKTVADGRLPLRFSEQAGWALKEIEVNRALEGMFKEELASRDTHRLQLETLVTLPGWPADCRIEVYDTTLSGTLLEQTGGQDRPLRKVLLKNNGLYIAANERGERLDGTPEKGGHLLFALRSLLSDAERGALSAVSEEDVPVLQRQLAQKAAHDRDHSKRVLGKKVVPEWLSPPMNIDISTVAYPLSIRGLWSEVTGRLFPSEQLQKIRRLYPSFSVSQANAFARSLNVEGPQLVIELDRRRLEYETLSDELNRWVGSPYEAGIFARQTRFFMRDELLKAWRRETPERYDANGVFTGYTMTITHRFDVSLPALMGADFSHVSYLYIQHDRQAGSVPVDHAPAYEVFLNRFKNLRTLIISGSHFSYIPASVSEMNYLSHLQITHAGLPLNSTAIELISGLTQLEHLVLDNSPLEATPTITAMPHLHSLSLRSTGINQWPIGAEGPSQLNHLDLRANVIEVIPESVFTLPEMVAINGATYLHDNPLSEPTLERINVYRRDHGIGFGSGDIEHVQTAQAPVSYWTAGIELTEMRGWHELWGHIIADRDSTPSSADLLMLLSDLTKSSDYTASLESRIKLTQRVKALLESMKEHTELRHTVYSGTYGAGTCGDGAIITFNRLELLALTSYSAQVLGSDIAERRLLELAEGMYYLRLIDDASTLKAEALFQENPTVDKIEVALYYRISLKDEFKLPMQPQVMLFESLVKSYDPAIDADINALRVGLRALGQSGAAQESLLNEAFWIDYLKKKQAPLFRAIESRAKKHIEQLADSYSDKQSDAYLDELQRIVDAREADNRALIVELTERAQQLQ